MVFFLRTKKQPPKWWLYMKIVYVLKVVIPLLRVLFLVRAHQ